MLSPVKFQAISEVAKAASLSLHIDGARLWNAATALSESPASWGQHADSLTFCLSKGLGAPVGSMLCGDEAFIRRAHRFRKMLGGGMRQVGHLAAAGLYALREQRKDLVEDHRRARALAEHIHTCPGLEVDLTSVESNIVIFRPTQLSPVALCEQLSDRLLLCPFGPDGVRAVLHRDIDDDGLQRACEALSSLS